jgi:hypothetical protein
MSNPVRRAVYAARHSLVLLFLFASPTAIAQAKDDEKTGYPVEALMRIYLECENTALLGKPHSIDIMRCSVIYEELKLRAFDGDFRKLHSWWKSAQSLTA